MVNLSVLLKDVQVLERINSEDVSIGQIEFDSRRVKPSCLFVAEKGEVSDGHNYIEAAISNGAVAVVVEDMPEQ